MALLEMLKPHFQPQPLKLVLTFLISNIRSATAASEQGPDVNVYIDYTSVPPNLDLVNWRRVLIGLNLVLCEPDTNRDIQLIGVTTSQTSDPEVLHGFLILLQSLYNIPWDVLQFIIYLHYKVTSNIYETLVDTTQGYQIPTVYMPKIKELYESKIEVMRQLGFYRTSGDTPITWSRPRTDIKFLYKDQWRCSAAQNKDNNSQKEMQRQSQNRSPVVKSFLAGSFSGTCSTVLFQPLDLVKTRIQVPNGASGPVGILSIVDTVVRQEKLVGLWRGLVPVYVPMCTRDWSDQKRAVESILIGAAARTVSVVTVIPFTVIKTRFESGKFNYKSMFDAFTETYKCAGPRALFSGMAPTLMRDVPFSGLYYMFYSRLKTGIDECGYGSTDKSVLYFCCGIMSGMMASMITQPADVIKTHMQLSPKEHRKILLTVKYLYDKGGLRGFFCGIIPRTLRRTLMAAMAWTVYEEVSYIST
ncbi:hypothetical protein FSP39_018805 [Pinctada imbricata]|uniref:Solute carrier family 25 member 38 homolog n=1 Tax=Pinctada imbricata TaxID=66713 RepID=A0AA88XS25_PINIB|nr:hypothetical protein FSP39_018805 [Pinctada imbricata]